MELYWTEQNKNNHSLVTRAGTNFNFVQRNTVVCQKFRSSYDLLLVICFCSTRSKWHTEQFDEHTNNNCSMACQTRTRMINELLTSHYELQPGRQYLMNQHLTTQEHTLRALNCVPLKRIKVTAVA